MKPIKLQLERMKKRQCIRCGKPMKNDIDNITGKISKYIWIHNCDCFTKNVGIFIG